MKILAVNGSPRKTWNTSTLLEKALEGAASRGAETEMIHLYDLDFKGCTSCFSCKLKGGKSYGKCAMNDGLTPVLEKLAESDAFVLGSPIYLAGPSPARCQTTAARNDGTGALWRWQNIPWIDTRGE